MTERTNAAAEELRSELHRRTLDQVPQEAYSTIADLIAIVDRARQLISHIEDAAAKSTDADDGDRAGRAARLNNRLLDARNHLYDVDELLNEAHCDIGHLIWTQGHC